MKNTIVIGVLCVLALAGGAWLYFRSSVPVHAPSGSSGTAASAAAEVAVPATVLDSGSNATAYPERKNYAIYDGAMFKQFWTKVHGSADGMPAVDFSKEYVLAIFAGTKPTGGYAVSVERVMDTGAVRTVEVAIQSPGAGCQVTEAQTAPYVFVAVPFSGGMTLTHVDAASVKDCK